MDPVAGAAGSDCPYRKVTLVPRNVTLVPMKVTLVPNIGVRVWLI